MNDNSIQMLFLKACESGDLSSVKRLFNQPLNSGFNINKAPSNLPERPLVWAAENGHLDIVKYLVEEQHANLHLDKESALCWAAHEGHNDVVQYLIQHGANINILKDNARWSEEYVLCKKIMDKCPEGTLVMARNTQRKDHFEDTLSKLKKHSIKRAVRRRSHPHKP